MSVALFILAAAAAKPAVLSPDQTARTMISVFAVCAVGREPDLARKTVLEDWDARQIIKDQRLLRSGCIGRGMQLSFQAFTLKGAMASLLTNRELHPGDVEAVRRAPALSYVMPDPLRTVDDKGRPLRADKVERKRQAIAKKISEIAIMQFGECVARANPAAVPPLAKTVLGSDAEARDLKPFWPNLSPCLPTGVKMELDPTTLRNAITLAYYRLAMAARQPRSAEGPQ